MGRQGVELELARAILLVELAALRLDCAAVRAAARGVTRLAVAAARCYLRRLFLVDRVCGRAIIAARVGPVPVELRALPLPTARADSLGLLSVVVWVWDVA